MTVHVLRERADSYIRDAERLRHEGLPDDALIYEAVARELRKVAELPIAPETAR